jgi:hypothetical protein
MLPLAFLAIALLVDATGPGAEHGLAEAYPRRLWLLVAYAVLVPLAILALRRQIGGSDAFRDGLTLATALTGLMCLAWRPGLLLFAPPVRESTAFESAVPAPPELSNPTFSRVCASPARKHFRRRNPTRSNRELNESQGFSNFAEPACLGSLAGVPRSARTEAVALVVAPVDRPAHFPN